MSRREASCWSVKGVKSDSFGIAVDLEFFGGLRCAGNGQAIFARSKRFGITINHAALLFVSDDLGRAAVRGVHGGAAVAGIRRGGNLQRFAGLEVAPHHAGFGQIPEPFVNHDDEGLAQGQVAPGNIEGHGLDDDAPAPEGFFDCDRGAAFGAQQDGDGFVAAGVKLMAAEDADAVNIQAVGVGQQDGGGMIGGREAKGR